MAEIRNECNRIIKSQDVTILTDGMIVTQDVNRSILKDKALVIKGRYIAEIGEKEDILFKYLGDKRFKSTVISCKGRVIFPGFINTHVHTAQSIVRGIAEDLGCAPSYTSFVPQGDDLSKDEIYIFSLLGAAGALRFGSTFIGDNYVNSEISATAFKKIGIRALVSERLHDMDFHFLADNTYVQDKKLGDTLLERSVDLLERYNDSDNSIQACFGPHAVDTW